MNKTWILFFLFITQFVYSQTSNKDISINEALSNNSGNIIERDFKTFITFKKMDIQIMKVYNITAGDSTTSVRFEYYYKSSSNSYLNETKIGIVEKSELKDLITTAKFMENNYFKNIYNNYKEISYKCISGLKIGGYVDTGNSNVWVRYIKLENDSSSNVYFNGPEFRELITYLEKIQELIK